MSKLRRVRATVPAKYPGHSAFEGAKAAWWRSHVKKLSRPALGELLGLTNQTIARYEAMQTVPPEYKLACAALAGRIEFDWHSVKAKIGETMVTF